jgi:hypothetical protein
LTSRMAAFNLSMKKCNLLVHLPYVSCQTHWREDGIRYFVVDFICFDFGISSYRVWIEPGGLAFRYSVKIPPPYLTADELRDYLRRDSSRSPPHPCYHPPHPQRHS